MWKCHVQLSIKTKEAFGATMMIQIPSTAPLIVPSARHLADFPCISLDTIDSLG